MTDHNYQWTYAIPKGADGAKRHLLAHYNTNKSGTLTFNNRNS